ncbi:MAG: MlaD family protein [Acidobacteriota bacterium]
MPRDAGSTVRVGALLLAAMLAFAVGVFLIGEENNLFRPMNRYEVRFESASGLQEGNPVQLNGVSVGRVERIVLAEDPSEQMLTVRILVDRRYARRVRRDSQARIKTLGLLGDKFVEITSGSDEAVVIPNDGEIDAAPATNVDRLIASGEDAVENIVAISVSLAKILDRLERGEGVLGQLMAPVPKREGDKPMVETVRGFLDTVDRLGAALEEGKSPAARMLFDEEMGASLSRSVERFESVAERFDGADGLLPSLLEDPAMKERAETTLANLESASTRLAALAQELESSDGLLPRLMSDEAYAERITGELEEFLERLNRLAEKVEGGDGTVARLIEDPAVYEAISDIIVGVEESKLLRWLVRNRQRAGIEKRYRDESSAPDADDSGTEP